MITLVANGSVGDCLPTAFSANAELVAELTAQIAVEVSGIADLNARLEGAVTASLTPPTVMLDAALVGQLAAAVTAPSFALNIAGIVGDIQAELAEKAAALAELQGKLAAAVAISASFGSAGLRLYRYTGPLEQMGGEIAAYTAGSPGDGGMQQSAEVTGIFFVTDIPAVATVLDLVL